MLSSISLSCAVDILKEKEINMTNQYDFICFMETSYEDDNMDLLLNTFCRLKENKNDLKVVLKMPEYETQYKYVYPLHNSASKEEKLFMRKKLVELDYLKVLKKIKDCNLEDNVEIVKENLTIEKISEMIGRSKVLVSLRRDFYVPLQVYIAYILKKIVIVDYNATIKKEMEGSAIRIAYTNTDFEFDYGKFLFALGSCVKNNQVFDGAISTLEKYDFKKIIESF